jgi:hypothetical protein
VARARPPSPIQSEIRTRRNDGNPTHAGSNARRQRRELHKTFKLCSLPDNRREPRCQSSVHVAHGREGLRLNAEAPAIFVIDDDETIGAADWDYTAKQDINGTTAEIRGTPLGEKPILNSFRVYYS